MNNGSISEDKNHGTVLLWLDSGANLVASKSSWGRTELFIPSFSRSPRLQSLLCNIVLEMNKPIRLVQYIVFHMRTEKAISFFESHWSEVRVYRASRAKFECWPFCPCGRKHVPSTTSPSFNTEPRDIPLAFTPHVDTKTHLYIQIIHVGFTRYGDTNQKLSKGTIWCRQYDFSHEEGTIILTTDTDSSVQESETSNNARLSAPTTDFVSS